MVGGVYKGIDALGRAGGAARRDDADGEGARGDRASSTHERDGSAGESVFQDVSRRNLRAKPKGPACPSFVAILILLAVECVTGTDLGRGVSVRVGAVLACLALVRHEAT